MGIGTLPDAVSERLRHSPFTYDAVGATAGEFPLRFAAIHRSRTLPPDVEFAAAAAALMSWRMHAGAGLQVAVSSPTVVQGTVLVLGLGWGRVRVSAPCRIVYVIDEPARRGFAYGTLPGHPESGEERFVVEQRPDGRIELHISAFSRPATVLAKLAGPIARRTQRLVTTRYLHALDT